MRSSKNLLWIMPSNGKHKVRHPTGVGSSKTNNSCSRHWWLLVFALLDLSSFTSLVSSHFFIQHEPWLSFKQRSLLWRRVEPWSGILTQKLTQKLTQSDAKFERTSMMKSRKSTWRTFFGEILRSCLRRNRTRTTRCSPSWCRPRWWARSRWSTGCRHSSADPRAWAAVVAAGRAGFRRGCASGLARQVEFWKQLRFDYILRC